MHKVAAQLIAGPLVAFGVGVGDGVIGQAHFGDRHDNVRSLYRLGVLGLGALGLAMNQWPEAALGAMSGAAALVGSRVVPAVNGGGWQQFGYVAGDPAPRSRSRATAAAPEPVAVLPLPPGNGAPGQPLGAHAGDWRGRARGYLAQQASGLL